MNAPPTTRTHNHSRSDNPLSLLFWISARLLHSHPRNGALDLGLALCPQRSLHLILGRMPLRQKGDRHRSNVAQMDADRAKVSVLSEPGLACLARPALAARACCRYEQSPPSECQRRLHDPNAGDRLLLADGDGHGSFSTDSPVSQLSPIHQHQHLSRYQLLQQSTLCDALGWLWWTWTMLQW